MKKLIKISTTRVLSNQLKKALFYCFLEAKKKKTNIINSQFLLCGILKSSNGTASKALNKIYKSRTLSDPRNKILSSIEAEFQTNIKSEIVNKEVDLANFSRPVRRLLFFLFRSTKVKNCSVITTLDVFNYLLRNKSVKKFINECLKNN